MNEESSPITSTWSLPHYPAEEAAAAAASAGTSPRRCSRRAPSLQGALKSTGAPGINRVAFNTVRELFNKGKMLLLGTLPTDIYA